VTRFAHLGDLHIGSSHLSYRAADGRNQRTVDFEQAALIAARQAVASNIDFAVIAGDTLDETNMMPGPLSGAVKLTAIFAQAGVPLLVIGGNHDEPEAIGRYSALKFLAEHNEVQLYLEQTAVDLAGVRLHMVPYRVLSRAQRGRGELLPFAFAEDRPNILVAHGYAPGEGVPEIPEGMETVIPAEWLSDPRFKICLLGHIHHHGKIAAGVFYSGSVERRNFGECQEEPGFWIHEIAADGSVSSESVLISDLDEAKEVNLPRPMASHSLDTANLTPDQVDRQVNRLLEATPTGAMVRIVLDNVSDSLGPEYRKQWQRKHRDNGGLYLDVTVHNRRASELLAVDFAEPPEDISQGLLEFIGGQEMTADRDEVVALASDLISEARDFVLVQDGGE